MHTIASPIPAWNPLPFGCLRGALHLHPAARGSGPSCCSHPAARAQRDHACRLPAGQAVRHPGPVLQPASQGRAPGLPGPHPARLHLRGLRRGGAGGRLRRQHPGGAAACGAEGRRRQEARALGPAAGRRQRPRQRAGHEEVERRRHKAAFGVHRWLGLPQRRWERRRRQLAVPPCSALVRCSGPCETVHQASNTWPDTWAGDIAACVGAFGWHPGAQCCSEPCWLQSSMRHH
jgi:hypothetical protein